MSRADSNRRSGDEARPIRVIGIFGLGHSGSTLLERCISSHPDCVGLGEIDETIRQARAQGLTSFPLCTCGETADRCPVWAPLADSEGDENSLLFATIERAVTVNRREVAVDSSKRKEQADSYLSLEREGYLALVPVYLYRDVRSWVLSRKVSSRDTGTGTLAYIVRSWRWMRSVIRGRRALARMGVRPVLVRYEDLVRSPSTVLAPVFERAGLRTDIEINPGASCQHALKGNGMRLDPSKNSRIIVDEKWRSDWRTRLLAPAVFGPLIYNYVLGRKVNADLRSTGERGSGA